MVGALLVAAASACRAQLVFEAPRPVELPFSPAIVAGLPAATEADWGELKAQLGLPEPLQLPAVQPPAALPAERRYRTLFISDFHLGQKGNQSERLLSFLASVDADKIYLVGDIFDGLALKRNGKGWSEADALVLKAIYAKKAAGTEVVYIPGNHDYVARRFAGQELGGIPIVREAVHQTADGRRLWIVHGDQYDRKNARAISRYGWVFRPALTSIRAANRRLNRIRNRFRSGYVNYIGIWRRRLGIDALVTSHFRKAVSAAAQARGYDGVVAGHIHTPGLKEEDGFVYANTGDWMENGTAVVEHPDGRLELLRLP